MTRFARGTTTSPRVPQVPARSSAGRSTADVCASAEGVVTATTAKLRMTSHNLRDTSGPPSRCGSLSACGRELVPRPLIAVTSYASSTYRVRIRTAERKVGRVILLVGAQDWWRRTLDQGRRAQPANALSGLGYGNHEKPDGNRQKISRSNAYSPSTMARPSRVRCRVSLAAGCVHQSKRPLTHGATQLTITTLATLP